MKIPIITAAIAAQEPTVRTAGIAAVTSGAAAIATVDWAQGIFGVNATVILACFWGSAISLWFLPPMEGKLKVMGKELPIPVWVMPLSIGIIAGAYLTPLIAKLIDTTFLTAVGFGVGFSAYWVMSNIFVWIKRFGDRKAGGND